MKRYKSSNGCQMMEGTIFNWEINKLYRDGAGPEIYKITLGSMQEMHLAIFRPEDKTLTFTQISGGTNFSLFEVENFELAELFISAFSRGMKVEILPLFLK